MDGGRGWTTALANAETSRLADTKVKHLGRQKCLSVLVFQKNTVAKK